MNPDPYFLANSVQVLYHNSLFVLEYEGVIVKPKINIHYTVKNVSLPSLIFSEMTSARGRASPRMTRMFAYSAVTAFCRESLQNRSLA
jgi:hypothetical protein